MIKSFYKKLGRLEPFEIKNSGRVLRLGSPSTFIYLSMLSITNTDLIIPFSGNYIFSALFLVVGLLAYLKNKFISRNYGWLVFFSILSFQHYLTYTTDLNNFTLDIILVTYVFAFGSLLLLSNLTFVLIYSASQLIHLFLNVYYSDLDRVTENAIVLSMTTLFIFSFLLMRELFKNRSNLEKVNHTLESKVLEHTYDLEYQTKELATKNAELEEFAYVVSHDLKRPLRNIYTLTDWLTEDEPKLNEKELENLKLIKQQVSQMDLLVEGVLSYSLQVDESLSKTNVNLQDLVKSVISAHASKDCEIIIEQELPIIIFNEPQILKVFQNLIRNAIKHNDKDQIYIKVGYNSEKLQHVFSIEDNGPGINANYYKKVFQLFQMLNPEAHIDSVGIGLALVKKIIEQHGGTIWLESEQGKGTKFSFTIPKS